MCVWLCFSSLKLTADFCHFWLMTFSNPIAGPNYFQLFRFFRQPLLTNFEFDPNDFVDSNVFEQLGTKESEFVNTVVHKYKKPLYLTGLIYFLIQPSDKNYTIGNYPKKHKEKVRKQHLRTFCIIFYMRFFKICFKDVFGELLSSAKLHAENLISLTWGYDLQIVTFLLLDFSNW